MDEMKDLVAKLNIYASKYYTLDSPIVSDKEYDVLYDRLVSLEDFTGIVLPDSPTLRVGDKVLETFESYEHKSRLYSLAKSQSLLDLESWWKRITTMLSTDDIECSCEYKYDGLTVNLSYDQGRLVRATTRGDGIKGENVTAQAKTISTIPHIIDFKGAIEVQGECIMKLSALENYNNTHSTPLKNARNAAAGALRNLDPKVTAERHLDFIAYSVGYSRDKDFTSQSEIIEFLTENKFDVGNFLQFASNMTDIFAKVTGIGEARPSLDYLIDGAVIKVNNINMRDELGSTEKAPRWAIAYKFEADEVSTILKEVVWQVARTGKINPLAILESVELAGATISRATLNNMDDIARKDIKIGSRVFLRRSNDVIPEILGVAEHFDTSMDIIAPEFCPSCGASVTRDGSFIYCNNIDNCSAVNIGKITHFASRDAMDIEGLSDRTITDLYNAGHIKSIADIYKLDSQMLLNLDGFKDKKTDKILKAISASKEVSLDKFVFALGIGNIGKKSASVLAEHYVSLNTLIKCQIDELVTLSDFGEIMAKSVSEYFADEENIRIIEDMLLSGVEVADFTSSKGVLSGLTICLTGSLPILRGKAKQLVISNGGKISDSVSKNVNIVVAGEDAGSKLAKANKLALEVWSYEELISKIGN